MTKLRPNYDQIMTKSSMNSHTTSNTCTLYLKDVVPWDINCVFHVNLS